MAVLILLINKDEGGADAHLPTQTNRTDITREALAIVLFGGTDPRRW